MDSLPWPDDTDSAAERQVTTKHRLITDGGTDAITEPVSVVTDAVVIADDFADGELQRGRVVLGQEEIVFFTDTDGESEWFRFGLDSITDLAPGYIPAPYADAFTDSIAFSYRKDDEDQGTAVFEPHGTAIRRFLIALLSQILDGKDALIAHPTERGTQETDVEPEIIPLYAHPYELEFGGDSDRGTGTTIKFSSIIHLEEIRLYYEGSHHLALSIRHLQTIGPPLTTELRLVRDRHHILVKRILMWEYNRRVRKIREIALTPEEKEFLRALHDSSKSRDTALSAILDKRPDELTEMISILKNKGLIRETSSRIKLTQTGYMLFTHEKI